MRGIGLIALAVLALLPQSQAPAAPAAGGPVGGRVVHALTKEPLRGAVVAAGRTTAGIASGTPATAFLTDADGAFVLRGVPAGQINLTVSKTGYLTAHHTAALAIAPGRRIDDVVIALTPSATISGRVLDPAGNPVFDATVRAVQHGGPTSSRATTSATTDDRGAYVIDRLAAGDYVVGAAQSVSGPLQIPEAETVSVEVAVGEERAGVDVRVSGEPATAGAFTVAASRPGGRSREARRGTAAMAGTVRSPVGRPLARMMVVALQLDERPPGSGRTGEPLATWGSTSDERGAFLIRNLPAGSYFVVAARTPRWAFAPGATRPNVPGPPIRVTDGDQIRDLDIVIPEPGAISGTIRDDFGDPVRATVSLMAAGPMRDRIPAHRQTTDDRGRYRFGALPAGAYLLMAERTRSTVLLHAGDGSGGARAVAPAPVFYAGVPSYALAAVLQVGTGVELQGIDMIAGHVPVAAVQLSVIAPAGMPVGRLTARVMPLDASAPPVGESRSDGEAIVFDAVPAGHWRFAASGNVATPLGDEMYWATRELATDGMNAQTATLTLEPGARASGRIAFEGQGPRPQSVEVWLRDTGKPARPGAPPSIDARVEVATDGAFQFTGLMPGRYAVQASVGPDGGEWTLARATVRGTDVLDLPIDLTAGMELSDVVLTLSDRVSELSGTATDPTGRPLVETALHVFPADARYHWPGSRHLRTVVTDQDGRYAVRGLPPGDYLIGAPPAATVGASLLLGPGAVPAAARVTLAAGERTVQDVRIAR